MPDECSYMLLLETQTLAGTCCGLADIHRKPGGRTSMYVAQEWRYEDQILTLRWRIMSLPAWCLTWSILLCQITALYSVQCSLDTTYVVLLRVLQMISR